jgi:hypothetical protein
VKSYSPQIIRKELALIRSRSDDKVDELMRAVHKAQDLAFHLKAAEKNKTFCFKKQEQVCHLQRQLSFWQHMNAVQNEKITEQLDTISKGRDELAGLNEQIFEMQERLVKIRVKFGVGNKEHKAPSILSARNNMVRTGRISASAEPTLFVDSNNKKNHFNGDINIHSPGNKKLNYIENLLLEDVDENSENHTITTKRCWQDFTNIKSLESPPALQNTKEKDIVVINGRVSNTMDVTTKISSNSKFDLISVTNNATVPNNPKSNNDSASETEENILSYDNEQNEMSNFTVLKNEIPNTQISWASKEVEIETENKSTNHESTIGEDDSFIKLLSEEDDDPVNTDEDSDVMTHPVTTQDLEMVSNIPPVIKNASRSAGIRTSRSLSPYNEHESCVIDDSTNETVSINGEKTTCDIKINVEDENGIVKSTEREIGKLSIKANDDGTCKVKKESPNSTKRVSFEHSAMLRSACVEGNLDLVKSLNFGMGRDIKGKLFQ